MKGKPVSEADIAAWADEADQGYDVTQLRKRGRKPAGDGPVGSSRYTSTRPSLPPSASAASATR